MTSHAVDISLNPRERKALVILLHKAQQLDDAELRKILAHMRSPGTLLELLRIKLERPPKENQRARLLYVTSVDEYGKDHKPDGSSKHESSTHVLEVTLRLIAEKRKTSWLYGWFWQRQKRRQPVKIYVEQ